MLTDKLVRDMHLVVLDRPGDGDLAIVRSADVSVPGNLATGELEFRIQDLRNSDLVLWSVDKQLVVAALEDSGSDYSVGGLRQVLSRLYVERVGDFEVLERLISSRDPGVGVVLDPDRDRGQGDYIRSGGDIEGPVGQSGGPGDPDLDF